MAKKLKGGLDSVPATDTASMVVSGDYQPQHPEGKAVNPDFFTRHSRGFKLTFDSPQLEAIWTDDRRAQLKRPGFGLFFPFLEELQLACCLPVVTDPLVDLLVGLDGPPLPCGWCVKGDLGSKEGREFQPVRFMVANIRKMEQAALAVQQRLKGQIATDAELRVKLDALHAEDEVRVTVDGIRKMGFGKGLTDAELEVIASYLVSYPSFQRYADATKKNVVTDDSYVGIPTIHGNFTPDADGKLRPCCGPAWFRLDNGDWVVSKTRQIGKGNCIAQARLAVEQYTPSKRGYTTATCTHGIAVALRDARVIASADLMERKAEATEAALAQTRIKPEDLRRFAANALAGLGGKK